MASSGQMLAGPTTGTGEASQPAQRIRAPFRAVVYNGDLAEFRDSSTVPGQVRRALEAAFDEWHPLLQKTIQDGDWATHLKQPSGKEATCLHCRTAKKKCPGSDHTLVACRKCVGARKPCFRLLMRHEQTSRNEAAETRT